LDTRTKNEQKNIRDRARQKAEKTKLKEDVAVWRKEKLILKHQITQSKRNAWNTFVSKLNYKTDGQKAFKFRNKLNNKYSQKQLQPLKVQDKEITDDNIIANCLNAYFTNAHKLANNLKKQEKYFKRRTKIPTNSNFKEIFNSNFSEEELKEAIRNTKKKKQPGPDNIFPEFVHNLGPKAMKVLTTIYNKLWNSSVRALGT